ncbi:MAG TPA: glutamate--tRNA ligase [Candidatus Binatia bacterium]|nr:glutamate--tRNA ligase [Candidatus Binatia bacterium]
MSAVRTRFAPSPTGFLHLGGARTALFNWLFARHHGGTFVLRIEDTDRERSEDRFVDAIREGLEWLGLDHDEGPFFQSRRLDLYAERTRQLIEGGHAYYCYCSVEELEAKRASAEAAGHRPVYDRKCRDLGRRPQAGEKPVIRLRCPLSGETAIDDMVRGYVLFDNAELDDLILVRSDGSPTFHLTVVVDDIEMNITHVLRGEDHLTNTPRQIQIYRGLGAKPPRFGHLSLIVGTDRARLSKRHGATAVSAYRDLGFLPEAVVNYLARLGWSHGDQEIFTREQLVAAFDVAAVNRAAAAFDMEKFAWVNAQHMKMADDAALVAALAPHLASAGEPEWPVEYLCRVVGLLRERTRTLVEMAAQAHVFVSDDIRYDAQAVAKFLGETERRHIDVLCVELEAVDSWELEKIQSVFHAIVERTGFKLGKLAQPVRVALTGGTVSPGIFEVCAILGKERTLARLAAATAGARDGTLPLATESAAAGPQ